MIVIVDLGLTVMTFGTVRRLLTLGLLRCYFLKDASSNNSPNIYLQLVWQRFLPAQYRSNNIVVISLTIPKLKNIVASC